MDFFFLWRCAQMWALAS